MNKGRIVLGGLVAGVVMAVLDGLNNGVLHAKAWDDAYGALNLHPSMGAIGAFWSAFDLVMGLIMAFLYAAMRPRLGPGPRTAVVSGVLVWLVVHMTLWSHLVDGVFPAAAVLSTSALELVSAAIGGLIVGGLYREA